MRKYLASLLAAAALSLTLTGVAPADADPSVHQIYEAASSGRLDEAQRMMNQVLRDHPNSSKAHYVQSELYAREGRLDLARAELERAELLSPGLPKENPKSVAELKSELALSPRGERPIGMSRQATPRFPWGTALIIALVLGVIWMLFRRRTTYGQYPPVGGPTVPPGTYGPGVPGPGGPVGGGGIGSAVAGGLAGGLAAGAGVVAAEELAHHFLDDGRPREPLAPAGDNGERNRENSDMGGGDFGVNDPSSWDDGSASADDGNGGGDDWT